MQEANALIEQRKTILAGMRARGILAKALRPPSEKWRGLVDTEIRYRHRYLDLMTSDEGTLTKFDFAKTTIQI